MCPYEIGFSSELDSGTLPAAGTVGHPLSSVTEEWIKTGLNVSSLQVALNWEKGIELGTFICSLKLTSVMSLCHSHGKK